MWVTQLNGSGTDDRGRWVSVDGDGNIYVTGEFSGTLSVGAESITSRGNLDMFLVKLGSDGRLLWMRQGGGPGIDRGYRLAVDGAGNCYVSGSYESKDFQVGDVSMPSLGARDAFLAKFSADGKPLWVRSAGGAGDDHGFGVAVDRRGDCLWTGAASGTANFSGTQVVCAAADYFLSKYHRDGSCAWVRHAGGKGADGGRGVAIDPSGNVLVAGFITGRAEFDGHFLGADKQRDVFTAKYDPAGKLIWARDGGGHSDAIGQAVESDAQGNVYITGMFKGVPVFGFQTLRAAGADDAFLTKYSPRGEVIWARRAGGAGVDYSLALAVRPAGEPIIAGDFMKEPEFGGIKLENKGKNDVFIAQYTAAGELAWVRTIAGPENNVCYAVALAPDGSVIIAPSFVGPTAFGDQTLTSRAGMDAVVGKMKPMPFPATSAK